MDATVPSLADIKFDDKGLVPAIVQDVDTGEILMMAWMNEESLNRTVEQGTTWFWSRSRQEFWNKGATSGNLQHVTDVRYDCDGDVLLIKVHPDGPACHTGERTCFFRSLTAP
jgi:phosphoribosyl-AMP cyclohydrolase